MSSFGPLFDTHFKARKPSRQIGKVQKISLQDHDQHYAPDSSSWKWRLVPILCLCCLVLVVMAGRLWQLQIINGAASLQASADNSLNIKTIPAPRGIIYDQNGQILARNQPSISLAVTWGRLPINPEERQRAIVKAHQLTKINQDDISKAVDQARETPLRATIIKTNVDRDTQIVVMAAKSELPGFSLEEDLIRSYPMGAAFSHLLGYTGSVSPDELKNAAFANYFPGESVGKSGVEQQYENYLHGQLGQRLSQVDALGALQDRQTEQAPKAGDNLHLTLDAGLQQRTNDLLSEAMVKYHTTGAVGIIQEPSTGRVLALVSLPSFDNNLFAQGIASSDYQKLADDPMRPLFNRSVAGTYPPGSLVKPLIGGQAVSSGVISADTIINSPSFIEIGTFRYADWTFWLGRSAPGPINVIQAIAQSSDTFFYQLGGGYQQVKGMGVQAITQAYRQTGFGATTGIDLPGEAKGTVPDPDWKAEQFPDDPGWYVGNTYQLAIGQSYLLTTPLQINAMTSAIANGGHLLQPQLVKKITDGQDQDLKVFSPQLVRSNVLSATGLKIAQDGMRASVATGIVFPFRTNPWAVAAKTGTAEFGTKNAVGEYQTHSWVSGYAPADNPKISFTVLLESGGSSTNAAQVANEIVKWYAENGSK